MVWALLALLGVPIWLVVGGLGAALWSRRSFSRQPGAFPAKVRGSSQGGWPRRKVFSRVVRDVLVLNSGLALVRTSVLAVDSASIEGGSQAVAGMQDPTVLALTFDGDEPPAQLAVASPLHPDLEQLVRTRRGSVQRNSSRPGQGREDRSES